MADDKHCADTVAETQKFLHRPSNAPPETNSRVVPTYS